MFYTEVLANRFRGVEVPNYIKPEDVDTSPSGNYKDVVYMGIALSSSNSETCLVVSLQLASIPTVVYGLADLIVSNEYYKKLVPGSALYWPHGDSGIRIGKMIQTIVEPTDFMNGRIRIFVDCIGERIFRNPT